jgi:Taurine catabolism dioxygenase TauD, TfdA family
MSFTAEVPIETPAAWTGEEITRSGSDDWRYELDDDDVSEVLGAVEKLKARGLDLAQIAPRNFELPRLGPKMKRISRELEFGRGFKLLRGLPVDSLALEDTRLAFFGLSTHLGIPVAQSTKNDILGDVRDETTVVDVNVRGYKSRIQLDYHNDCVDVVGLGCVRPARSGGVSRIVSAVSVYNVVMQERPDLFRVLHDEPCYYYWQVDGPPEQLDYYWFHAFSYFEGRLTTRWLPGALFRFQEDVPHLPRMSDELREALEFAQSVANRDPMALDMHFQRGDVQYLSDAQIWHSRTAFEDDEDPSLRRHLLRVWLSRYWQTRTAPDLDNSADALGDAAVWPRRRIYPVPVYDTW